MLRGIFGAPAPAAASAVVDAPPAEPETPDEAMRKLRGEALEFGAELLEDAKTFARDARQCTASVADEVYSLTQGRSTLRAEAKRLVIAAFALGLLLATAVYWASSHTLERRYHELHGQHAQLSGHLDRVRKDAAKASSLVKDLKLQVQDAQSRADGALSAAANQRLRAAQTQKRLIDGHEKALAKAAATAEAAEKAKAEAELKADPRMVLGNTVPKGRGSKTSLAAAANEAIRANAMVERGLSRRASRYVASNIFGMGFQGARLRGS